MDELRREQEIDKKGYNHKLIDDTEKKVAWKRPQENITEDGSVMIDTRTGEVLAPEFDYTQILSQFHSLYGP